MGKRILEKEGKKTMALGPVGHETIGGIAISRDSEKKHKTERKEREIERPEDNRGGGESEDQRPGDRMFRNRVRR